MQLLLLFSHNLRPAPGQAWEGHEGGYNTEGHRGAPSPARKPDPRGIVAGQWAGGVVWGGDDAMGRGLACSPHGGEAGPTCRCPTGGRVRTRLAPRCLWGQMLFK